MAVQVGAEGSSTSFPFAEQGTLGSHPFPHPLKGTCVSECGMYGRCHHCGLPTNPASSTDRGRHMVAGEPHVYRCGHHPRQIPGVWSRRGVPLEKVAPVIEALARAYGTLSAVGQLAGVSVNTLYGWRWKSQRDLPSFCNPEQVRQLYALARLARRPTRYSTFELPFPPRPPFPDESDAARRDTDRTWRRYYRGTGPRPSVVQTAAARSA